MKRCTKCHRLKTVTAFHKKSRQSPDGLAPWCRDCKSKDAKKYYKKNKQRINTRIVVRNRQIRKSNRLLILEYLRRHSCTDCGESDPVVLDFDHRQDKFANVSWLLHRNFRWKRILNEIEKCDVRCANCHRRKTSKTLNWFKSRKEYQCEQSPAP